MNKSESIAGLATALAKAQAELSNPKKTSANPFFKSKYADLSEVINVSKSILSEHGLSILQLPSFHDGRVHVETVITHSTGEYISDVLSLPVAKHDAQSIGSAITYARRYSWAAICGLAQEDDDAESAIGRNSQKQSKTETSSNEKEMLVDYAAQLSKAESITELGKLWFKIPKNLQPKLVKAKDRRKAQLEAA
jgi:hypothetical protein